MSVQPPPPRPRPASQRSPGARAVSRGRCLRFASAVSISALGVAMIVGGCGSPNYSRTGSDAGAGTGGAPAGSGGLFGSGGDVGSGGQLGTGGSGGGPISSGGVGAGGLGASGGTGGGNPGSGGTGTGGAGTGGAAGGSGPGGAAGIGSSGGRPGTGGAGTGGANTGGAGTGGAGTGGAATGGANTGGAATGGAGTGGAATGGANTGGAATGGANTGGAATGGAGTGGAPADPSRYNFETSTQSWMSAAGTTPFATIARDTTRHFLGVASLAGTIAATAVSTYQFLVSPTPAIPPGATVTFRVFAPTGAAIDWIQPYVQEGPTSTPAFLWNGTYTPAASIAFGAWTTVQVVVPATATPIIAAGVQFHTSGAWSGTVYVDSVNY